MILPMTHTAFRRSPTMRTILAALVLLAPADAGVKTSALPHGVDMRAPQPVARSADTDWLEQRRHEMKVLEAAEAAHDGEFETLNHRERAHRRRLQGRDPAHAGVREIERTLAVFKPAFMQPDGSPHNRRKGDLAAARLLMRLQHAGLTVVRQRLHSPTIPHPIAEALVGVEPGTADLAMDNPGQLGELAGPHARALRSLLEGPSMAVELEGPDAVSRWHEIAQEMGRGMHAHSKTPHEGHGPFHGSASDSIAQGELRLLFD